MPTFHIKRIESVDQAQQFWNQFTTTTSIYDDWGFRFCFYKKFNDPLYFYIGEVDGNPIGLMPLQFNIKKQHLEFFGGSYMDDNQVFIKLGFEQYIPEFYKYKDQKAELVDILGEDDFTKTLTLEDYKFVAALEGLNNHEDYLKKYVKRHKKQFVSRINSMVDQVRVVINNFSDLDVLIELNKKRFGADSTFHYLKREEIFHDLLTLKLNWHMISFIINDKVESVSMGVLYSNTYCSLASGTNVDDYPDLRPFVIATIIDEAIKLGAKSLDVGLGDCGWKEHWHFSKVPQYKFEK